MLVEFVSSLPQGFLSGSSRSPPSQETNTFKPQLLWEHKDTFKPVPGLFGGPLLKE